MKAGDKARVTQAFAIDFNEPSTSKLVGQTVEVVNLVSGYIRARFLTGPESEPDATFGPDHAWAFLPEELKFLE